MTSNQIIHMSRVRGALREIGMEFDPKVAVHDLEYMHQALVSAIEHPNSDVQESALCLAADFGLADAMRDVPFDALAAPRAPKSTPSIAPIADIPEFTSDDPLDIQPEPAALAYTAERLAVLRKYVGGMR
jgi:hypothetical protein